MIIIKKRKENEKRKNEKGKKECLVEIGMGGLASSTVQPKGPHLWK
jgi:hypothetical protein